MKLISEFNRVESAEKVSEDFRHKGILTFVSSADSKQLGSFKTGAVKVALWAMIDDQYEDALLLFKDPNYKVINQLTHDEMNLFEQQINCENEKNFESFTRKAILISIILLAILFVVFVSNQPR